MNDDVELEAWRSLWQTEVELPPGLRKRAKKQVRRLRMMLWADISVTLGAGGACAISAIRSAEPLVRLLAVWVWLTLITAWIFRWWNSGGNWTGAAPNTHVFLERLRKSYRVTLRNIAFGWILGLAQLAFCSNWVYRELDSGGHMSVWDFMKLPANLLLWACAAVVFAWSVWFFNKVKSELACVRRLQSEWGLAETKIDDKLGSRAAEVINEFILLVSKFEAPASSLRRKKRSWRV